MNPKFIPALIVDHNADSARAMAALVKDLFNKVFIQSEIGNVLPDVAGVKPAVVLMNLTLSQRAENLELAEMIGKTENPPLILGYSDSHEPELLAHALESGFQDLFMRPFDPDLIASKINKFFQHEKTLKHDISYSPLRPALPAKVKFGVRLAGCDENGITIECEHYISKGTVITLPKALSLQITGSEKTEFLVSKTWTGDSWDKHFFYAELKSPDDARSASLRKFIHGKTL